MCLSERPTCVVRPFARTTAGDAVPVTRLSGTSAALRGLQDAVTLFKEQAMERHLEPVLPPAAFANKHNE